MNPELLREAHPHVREEHLKVLDLNGVLESTVALAVAAFVKRATIDDLEALPGSPPALDAETLDWIDYFVGQGALVFHDQLPEVAAA